MSGGLKFEPQNGTHALYVRDRGVAQWVKGEPDTVVGNL